VSLVARLKRRRQLQVSASEALRTNLPLLQVPLASLPPAWPAQPRVPPLGDEYLADLWPDGLRNTQSEDYASLYNDFRWIADVAGRKIHQLDSSAPTSRQRSHSLAHIVEEARAFAAIAVESLQGQRRTENDDVTAGTAAAVSVPNGERLPVSGGDESDGGDGEQARLDRIVGFVARQEPQIAWAVGNRSDGTTVLACDLAFGWIPPRIAVPVDVELLAPSRKHTGIEELLGDVVRRALYKPGCTLAEETGVNAISAAGTRLAARCEDLIGELIKAASKRTGCAPAVSAVLTAPAGASDPAAAVGLKSVLAHVDAARRQLLSDYPLLDESVLSDCMLLCAIESCLIGDGAAATYHHRWFTALDEGGR
jgi:hypothetical protein